MLAFVKLLFLAVSLQMSIPVAKANFEDELLCSGDLGCFYFGNPWRSKFRPFPLPWHNLEISTEISLFTRNSTEGEQIQLWPSINITGSQFNPARNKTVFLTHGFASSGKEPWVKELTDAYLGAEDANVFVVDWGKGAKNMNYLQVAANTKIVSLEVARLITNLTQSNGLKGNKIHLIGHSLGSHIMSYAAKEMKKQALIIGRITALDPAQPGFELFSSMVRLNKYDADFVDVVHTDAMPTFPFMGFGILQPVGHVDFYVNGGSRQPGCLAIKRPKIDSLSSLLSFPVEVISEWVSCSHGRSITYFINSLKDDDTCALWGSKLSKLQTFFLVSSMGTLKLPNIQVKTFDDCTMDQCTLMGLSTPKFPARGSFLVTTTRSAPFCSIDQL